MVRLLLVTLALLSPFLFPWEVTLLLAGSASLFVPPVALLVGVLTDVLYYIPHAGILPTASLLGAAGFLAAYVVHGFLKTRILSP